MKNIKNLLKRVSVVAVICLAYRLKLIPGLICVLTIVVCNVFLEKQDRIKKQYLAKYNDVVLYMEQMIYSFKKQPKIKMALLDAQKVSSIEMREVIEEAIVNIDSNKSANIYEDALAIIEKEYNCGRIKSLHKFIIKIENYGGNYETYIDILLEDIKNWSDRTLTFIRNVDRTRRNVLISIASTLITCGFMAYLIPIIAIINIIEHTCGFMAYLIPKDYKFTEHGLYQVCSMILIMAMIFTYLAITKRLNFDWLKEERALPDNMVIKYYALVEKGYNNISDLSFMERINYKKAKKRLEREIYKIFPDWIRDVAINLQNDTVQSAIEGSYEDTPFILKRPVRKLLIDFERYPVGIEPYDNVLKEFDLPDVKSSVKMFYSINELGREQSTKQIGAIIDRNNKLSGQTEEMKNKDRIGIAAMYSVIPMFLGVLKIIVDMLLMILVFTSSISEVVK